MLKYKYTYAIHACMYAYIHTNVPVRYMLIHAYMNLCAHTS
jgi:hypothetical protein